MNRVVSGVAASVMVVASIGAVPLSSDLAPEKSPTKKAPKVVRHPVGTARDAVEAKPYQVGMASWYGKQFHGRSTASGEDFDMFELTAAHRALPLGTYVRVTNLRNGKWVIVRVNDRGPFVGDRIMDLSYSASRMIGIRDGVEQVRLDLVRSETIAEARPN